MSWSKRFDVPIALPDGSVIETLDQARRFLLALPAARHRDADVTAAIDAMLTAAEGRGPVMHANFGIARVVNAFEFCSRAKRTALAGDYQIRDFSGKSL